MSVVTPQAEESAPALHAASETQPGVVNIDGARKRPRMVLHSPVLPRHLSNLVRFNEPQVAVMRVPSSHREQASMADDYDCPPAA